jgi:carbon-monoxide dehydrogenase medium subunit
LASGASAAAAAVADEGTSPTADLNASEDYRRHLAKVLVRRGLEASAS